MAAEKTNDSILIPIKEIKSKVEFDNFAQEQSAKLRVIHFYANWCDACVEMDRLLLEFQSEFPIFEFAKVDAEVVAKVPGGLGEGIIEVSVENGVSSVPTILFFQKGNFVNKHEGFQPLEIKNLIVKYSTAVEPYTEGPKATSGEQNKSTGTENLNERLKKLINASRLTLFMKGNSEAPKCGFSRQIVDLLRENNVQFSTFDILMDEDVRQGLKKYSDWPTYPQLYLDGELLGGLDVVREEMSDPGFVSKLPKVE